MPRWYLPAVFAVLIGSAWCRGQTGPKPAPPSPYAVIPGVLPPVGTPPPVGPSPMTPKPSAVPEMIPGLAPEEPPAVLGGSPRSTTVAPHPVYDPSAWGPFAPPSSQASSSCNFDLWRQGNLFSPDYSTIEFRIGGYFSGIDIGPNIPTFNYVPVSLRCGWMLNSLDDWNPKSPWHYGNAEMLLDLTGAGITSDYGTAFGGVNLLFRYNCLRLHENFIPYLQVGGGFLITDAHGETNQRAIGQAFNVSGQAQIGLRTMLSDNLSFDFEWGYQHISNARMNRRNFGVNAAGATIGFTYFFPAGTR